jgi:hypothetical protein
MRVLLRSLCLVAFLGAGPPVLPPATFDVAGVHAQSEPRRGAAPRRELRQFQGGFQDEYAEPKVNVFGYVALTMIGAVLFLIMVVIFRHQAKELGLPDDETALASSGAAVGGGVGVGPKESVFGAVARAGGWVTAGRVALSAGISPEEAESFLEDLLREARIKAGRDKRGRRLYRAPE